jgi:sulfate adenylyltransferase subunit 2
VPDAVAGLHLLHGIREMMLFRRSERENRVIDHDQEGSMELKKREGYF